MPVSTPLRRRGNFLMDAARNDNRACRWSASVSRLWTAVPRVCATPSDNPLACRAAVVVSRPAVQSSSPSSSFAAVSSTSMTLGSATSTTSTPPPPPPPLPLTPFAGRSLCGLLQAISKRLSAEGPVPCTRACARSGCPRSNAHSNVAIRVRSTESLARRCAAAASAAELCAGSWMDSSCPMRRWVICCSPEGSWSSSLQELTSSGTLPTPLTLTSTSSLRLGARARRSTTSDDASMVVRMVDCRDDSEDSASGMKRRTPWRTSDAMSLFLRCVSAITVSTVFSATR
mmetsp:Transcript_6690/g.16415  ORF Transcript_6690/g.16415 Transcript_6690/m.16415 type:complete len:287 (-) Transcript_6690:271-1131(-)